MRIYNPVVIPRNHIVEEALDQLTDPKKSETIH